MEDVYKRFFFLLSFRLLHLLFFHVEPRGREEFIGTSPPKARRSLKSLVILNLCA